MRDDVTKASPHAVGPEKSILSTMLQDPLEYIGLAIEEGLTEAHFYQPAHQIIFAEMLSCYEQSVPIDLVSFVQLLLDIGKLDMIGGPATLTDIYTYSPSAGHFHYHLKFVKDKFTMRSVLNFCATTEQAVWDEPAEVEPLLDTAEAALMAIREGRESMTIESIKDAVSWVVEDFKKRVEGNCEIEGLSTGFPELDRMTSGLKPGEMFVIAARPSMGKTSLMMNIAENLTIDQEIPGLVFSCEMKQRVLVQRLIHSRARFDMSLLAEGYKPDKGELQRIRAAALAVARSGLIIDDTPEITISQLRAKARRKKREKGIKYIAIDYLQLMKSRTKQAENSREREIAEISSGIKGLAKELELPIIILAQLNRGPEGRTGKHLGVPRMSDLRESGAIEQDADLVGLLYRSAYYAEDDDDKAAKVGEAELILAKNRNGRSGNVLMTFIEKLYRFQCGRPLNRPDVEPVESWVR